MRIERGVMAGHVVGELFVARRMVLFVWLCAAYLSRALRAGRALGALTYSKMGAIHSFSRCKQ